MSPVDETAPAPAPVERERVPFCMVCRHPVNHGLCDECQPIPERVTVQDLLDCPDCIAATDSALIAACASVGIERGKSTGEMLRQYLAGWHRRGHPATQENAPG